MQAHCQQNRAIFVNKITNPQQRAPLDGNPVAAICFSPHNRWKQNGGNVVVRCEGDPANFAAPMRKAIASIDKDLALSRVLTAEQLFSDTLSRPRFGALLLASVATLGLFSYNWCVLRINNRANFVQRFSPITS